MCDVRSATRHHLGHWQRNAACAWRCAPFSFDSIIQRLLKIQQNDFTNKIRLNPHGHISHIIMVKWLNKHICCDMSRWISEAIFSVIGDSYCNIKRQIKKLKCAKVKRSHHIHMYQISHAHARPRFYSWTVLRSLTSYEHVHVCTHSS